MTHARGPNRRLALGVAWALGAASVAMGGGGSSHQSWSDASGDAVVRRTDSGNDGTINPASVLPDLLQIQLGGWTTPTPTSDPYSGSWTNSSTPALLRLDVVFAGVVNPPGTLGLGSQSFDPYTFGPSPVYGFIEFDVDRERDTGGECSGATLRYLANVARFGAKPSSSIGSRVAVTADDYDWSFNSSPQFERSGEEFSLVMCGCFAVTVVDTFGDIDGMFGPGDTWIVRGRFFQRAGGLAEASGAWGGSAPQAYDPPVNLRFSHDIVSSRTTISLVYAMTMAGAAQLTGQPQQGVDLSVANHTSVYEALQDVIAGALDPTSVCGHELSEGWATSDVADAMDPGRWRATALVGTSYQWAEDALYVWTDVGCNEHFGDFNSDELVNAADVADFDAYLAANDAGSIDSDGAANGSITLYDFGTNFCLYDLNSDGVINASDRAMISPPSNPPGDVNNDCIVNGADLSVILSNFGSAVTPGESGDINSDGQVNGADLSVFLANFGATC